jgi:hypothetical protein
MTAFVRFALALALTVPSVLAYASGTPPAFSAFPASAHAQRHSARLLLESAQDKEFQTALREAFRQPVNFAGHYVLTTIGCGASCVLVAALDATTGRVTWLPFTVCCWAAPIDEPVEFRRDSELLVIHGQRDEQGSAGPHYYRLTGGRFIALR